ncbi:MAG TPA: pseudouridine synthase [Bacteroidia bacterium]|jgi:23S rRNA pseudouridine2605 synthase|nr:pseudouridine synthase [Bacteroidia bacterium]
MPTPRKNKSSKSDVPPKTRRTRVGEERPFRKSAPKERFKPEGRGDFEGKGRSEGSERSSFRDKPSGGKPRGDKPFKKKEWGDKPGAADRPFQKKEWGDKSGAADRPYKKKEWGDKREGGRTERSDKPRFGDKPFKKKEWGDKPRGDSPRGDSARREKPYGDKPSRESKPFGKKDWGEKRSFGSKEEGAERSERRDSSGERPRFGASSRGGDSARSGGKSAGPYKPFRKKERDDDSKPARKPFERKTGDRPEKKSFSRANDSSEREGEKPAFKKPYQEKKKSFASPSPANEEGLIRLNKYIANAGICSRREADKLIETGVISVNGKIVTELGFKVSATDEINFGGQLLRKEKAVYILLNKPKDYITTLDDPEGRKTVLELIHNATKERVYPVGRLDRNTTGLLLLTNDGDLTKKLTHPRYGVKKIYQVTLDKALSKGDMQKIADGFELEDGPVKADDISYVGDGKDKNEVGIQLHSGRNRIVRRVFEHLGYDVVKLDRVYFAGLTKKDLPRGRWRLLTALEVSMLKMVPAE